MNQRQTDAMFCRVEAAASQMERAAKALDRHPTRLAKETAADCRAQANAIRRDAKAFLPRQTENAQ
jgi:hypothetical protein